MADDGEIEDGRVGHGAQRVLSAGHLRSGGGHALRERLQHSFVAVAPLRRFGAEAAAARIGADVAFDHGAAFICALEGFEIDGERLRRAALVGGDKITPCVAARLNSLAKRAAAA